MDTVSYHTVWAVDPNKEKPIDKPRYWQCLYVISVAPLPWRRRRKLSRTTPLPRRRCRISTQTKQRIPQELSEWPRLPCAWRSLA